MQLIFLFLSIISTYALQYKIINTPVLCDIGCLQFHHIIIFSTKNNEIYSLDFTPVDQSSIKSKLELITSKNIPAEIRIRFIDNIDYHNTKEIVREWMKNVHLTIEESKKLTYMTFDSISDKELKNIISGTIKEWPEYMNLYNHNCQHFSRFVINRYLK